MQKWELGHHSLTIMLFQTHMTLSSVEHKRRIMTCALYSKPSEAYNSFVWRTDWNVIYYSLKIFTSALVLAGTFLREQNISFQMIQFTKSDLFMDWSSSQVQLLKVKIE